MTASVRRKLRWCGILMKNPPAAMQRRAFVLANDVRSMKDLAEEELRALMLRIVEELFR